MTNVPTMKRRRRQCGQICLLLTGILLISAGLSIFLFFEAIYEYILRGALEFSPTSKSYAAWKTNDPPLTMDIYLFNWTNPQEVLADASVKPEFVEIGPYRFKEVKDKLNITWNENQTVSFMFRKTYYFDVENSVRQLNDSICTINAVPLTVSYKSKDFGYWSKKMISLGLSSISSLYVKKTAGEILFDGYEEPILSTLSSFPMLDVEDRFGIFYGKNGTVSQDGVFGMSYRQDESFGRMLTWNHRNRTDFYEGHCNDIRGSAGEFYPLNRKRDKLVLYSSELCKYADLEYDRDVVVKGVRGYRYVADNIFDNGTTRPENSCFCKGECIPSGVFNVSACRQNSPSFLSFPHFYAADPYYRNLIRGMQPDRDKHQFYIIIQPKSGIVMEIAARMQVNMLLQPVRHIRLYEKVPKVFIPLFYFTQTVHLRDELAANLRMIQSMPDYANYLVLIFCSLGLISICWALCSFFCCRAKHQKSLNITKINGNTHQYEEVALSDR